MIVLLTWLWAWSTSPMFTEGVLFPKLIRPKMPMIKSGPKTLKKIAPRLRKQAFSDDQVSITNGLRFTLALADAVPAHDHKEIPKAGRSLDPLTLDSFEAH